MYTAISRSKNSFPGLTAVWKARAPRPPIPVLVDRFSCDFVLYCTQTSLVRFKLDPLQAAPLWRSTNLSLKYLCVGVCVCVCVCAINQAVCATNQALKYLCVRPTWISHLCVRNPVVSISALLCLHFWAAAVGCDCCSRHDAASQRDQ